MRAGTRAGVLACAALLPTLILPQPGASAATERPDLARSQPTGRTAAGATQPSREGAGSLRVAGTNLEGSLGKALAGARLVLLAPSGLARAATAGAQGELVLDTVDFPVAGSSLHLLGPDGGYLGPVVLHVESIQGDHFGHTVLSGRPGRLGRLDVRAGYAVLTGASSRTYTRALISVDRRGRPAGAGNSGLSGATPEVPRRAAEQATGQSVEPAAAGSPDTGAAGADPDADGIPNLLDQDDDADGSNTPVGAAVVPGPAQADQPAPTDTQAAGPPVGSTAGVGTRLALPADRAINAHTSDVTGGQLAATMDGSGSFTISITAQPAALGITDPVASPWLSCRTGSWCGAGNPAVVLDPSGAQSSGWSDYPGRVWTTGPTGSTLGDAPVAAPGNGVDTVVAALDDTTAPTTTWTVRVAPRIPATAPSVGLEGAADQPEQQPAAEPQPTAGSTGADPASAPTVGGLPEATEVMELRYRSGSSSQEGSLLLSLGAYPVTVPVINEVLVGAIAGEVMSTAGGQVAITVWRPQRSALSAEEGGLMDMAGLYYGLVLSDGMHQFGCSAARYSGLVGLATAGATDDWLPLRDLAPSDLPPVDSEPVAFTLDVAGCLSDAQATTGILPIGSTISATLTAATNATGSAHQAAVPYRLIVP